MKYLGVNVLSNGWEKVIYILKEIYIFLYIKKYTHEEKVQTEQYFYNKITRGCVGIIWNILTTFLCT